LKKDYQILIISGKNIPDTTGHQTIIHFFTSLNVFFLHYLENQNQRNITFYPCGMIT